MKEKIQDGIKFVYNHKQEIGLALGGAVTVIYKAMNSDDSDSDE